MIGFRLLTTGLVTLLLLSVITRADPLDPKLIPGDTRWVLHVDMDAAKDSKTFDLFRDNFLSSDAAQAKIEQIEQITGTKFPDDLNDITIFGKDPGEEAGVILVHGKIDAAKTQSSLEMADQFASNPYGDYAIFTWFDKEKNHTMFAAFYNNSDLLVGRSEEKIENALDAMDGKLPSLKADSPLVDGIKPQQLLYVAAKDIPQLHQPGEKPNPVVNSVQTAWIALSEKDDTVTLHAQLAGSSADTAANLRTTLEGLKGMLTLAAGNEDADPVAKAVVGASKTFATTQQASAVMVDWPVSIDQLSAIVKAIAAKQAPQN